jgi:hypothetical protein
MTISAPNKGGRPRIHASAAARVAAWRANRKREAPAPEESVPPTTESQADWNKYLRKIGLSKTKGMFMKDAPQGCGKLHSGEHDTNRLLRLEEAAYRRRTGKVRPSGSGPDA